MPAPRYAKRRDKSESPLVKELRGYGASVYLMDVPCDALVGFCGQNHLVEFKTPDTYYGRALNTNQTEFGEAWQGADIVVLRTPDDVDSWAQEQLTKRKFSKGCNHE